MTPHVDILETRQSLKRPLVGSSLLHVALFSGLALLHWLDQRGRVMFGTPGSLGGGAVAITPVSSIPLPPRGGIVNPVANDTESRVPTPPKPNPRETERRQKEEEAIAIQSKRAQKRESEKAAPRSTYRPDRDPPRNQVYSSSGQAVSSPMYGSTTGSGSIGVGAGSPFGARFGWYEQLVREKVARLWRTGEVDPTLRTAPVVIVTFDILRDGSIRDLRILQRSGNYALDTSAQRAITEAAPFPSLPPGYERDTARIEFWFTLKR